MADGSDSKQPGTRTPKSSKDSAFNRRNILLGGTSIAAATALSVVDRTRVAQAQQPAAAPSGRKPNILVIFGGDGSDTQSNDPHANAAPLPRFAQCNPDAGLRTIVGRRQPAALRLQLGETAREYILREKDWKVLAQEYQRIYAFVRRNRLTPGHLTPESAGA